MESIFPMPIESLQLEGLKAFLADVGDEGLLWEAKGPDPRSGHENDPLQPRDITKAACGLANARGGYIILGAHQPKGQPWTLPGVTSKHPEPMTWISDVIGSLRPAPTISEPRIFKLDSERFAAVVEVHPISVPPCMCPGGEIYERTSGKTAKIIEPSGIARLMARGDRAVHEARELALASLEAVRKLPGEPGELMVLVGLRATAYEPDISSQLFAGSSDQRPSMADRVHRVMSAKLKPHPSAALVSSTSSQVRQDSFSFFIGDGAFRTNQDGGNHAWCARLGWDGTVAVRCFGNEASITDRVLMDDIVVPAWEVASELVPALGGTGPCHLAVRLFTGKIKLDVAGVGVRRIEAYPAITIERKVEGTGVSSEIVESIGREVLRAAGCNAWEPPLVRWTTGSTSGG